MEGSSQLVSSRTRWRATYRTRPRHGSLDLRPKLLILHQILQPPWRRHHHIQPAPLELSNLLPSVLPAHKEPDFHQLVPRKALDGFVGDLRGEFTCGGDDECADRVL